MLRVPPKVFFAFPVKSFHRLFLRRRNERTLKCCSPSKGFGLKSSACSMSAGNAGMVEVLSHLEADEILRFRVIEELRRTLLLDR
jgi:hypothetical protein